jgi:hypothetical protein
MVKFLVKSTQTALFCFLVWYVLYNEWNIGMPFWHVLLFAGVVAWGVGMLVEQILNLLIWLLRILVGAPRDRQL